MTLGRINWLVDIYIYILSITLAINYPKFRYCLKLIPWPSTPVLAQPVHMVCLQTGLLCGALAKRWRWWRNAGCETQTKGTKPHAKHVCFGWVSWGLEMAQGIVATHQKLQSKSYLSLLFCKYKSWRFTEPRLNVTILSEHRQICFFLDNT